MELERLAINSRQRLIACLNRRGNPHPIWVALLPGGQRWQFFLIIGFIALALMAVIGGGDYVRWPWILGWLLAAAPSAWGVLGWRHARRAAARVPCPEGVYVFATDIIDVRDGLCTLHNLDSLADVRLTPVLGSGGVAEYNLQFVVAEGTVPVRAGRRATAEMVLRKFWSARASYADAMAMFDWDAVAAFDPLYEPRYSEELERFSHPERFEASPSHWLGVPSRVAVWGTIVGLIAAPALWLAGITLRDEVAYRRARAADTVKGWRNYLQRVEPRHHFEVTQRHLPRAALAVAKKSGTAAALRELVMRHPNTPSATEAQTLLRAQFEQARKTVETDAPPQTRDALLAMLRWQEERSFGTIEMRFGASSEASLRGFDEVIELLKEALRSRGERAEIVPIAPSFAGPLMRAKEDAILAAVQRGFDQIFPAGLIEIRRGGQFSGVVTAFERPTLAVQWVAEPQPVAKVDTADGKMYVDLGFRFSVNLAVPGRPPSELQFIHEPGRLLPTAFSSRRLPDGYSGKPLYEFLIAQSFDELHQRIASDFFPRQQPVRMVKLPQIESLPLPPVAMGPQRSATGFCVSSSGFIVTAHHFTSRLKKIQVQTAGGPLDAEVVADDPVNDVALLKVRGTLPALPIRASESVKLGETVATIGFPKTDVQGVAPKVGRGEISSPSGLRDDPSQFQVSVPVQPGNSGGPLFDMNGNVVGVMISVLRGRETQNVNYAVKSRYLLDLLANVPGLPSPTFEDARAGLRFEDLVERVVQSIVLIEGYE